ncbi:uncharacterized protein LAESUDRAFT_755644 [Laetiporus sulphureus 93-53]|uniref:Tyrosine--tRNA ligase n=1 Tax=Laetiporus sulphureus 93-53 TaxID=1314785 RepID=A0A165GYX8_9APHY|nr:uncharacterized protein LAESUDRAFT_755644 [Laetiporus sulphureus 93-53]KZT11016.1 hypothetical protein LAESUDRAFT_755644 [Laetiporus sulphureus 93-53]
MQHCRHVLRRTSRQLNFHGIRQLRTAHTQSDLLDELRSRGLVSDITRPEQLASELKRERQTVYAGVDPTAKSLHVGHLLPFLCLFHFQLRGHQIIPLIGGATGLIGDPSGRSTERPLSRQPVVEENVVSLTAAIQRFYSKALDYAEERLQFSSSTVLPPDVRNNIEWLREQNLLEFLRTVGIHSRVNSMLARESVKARLASQQGISFAEFTYQLLQSYDFLTLHQRAGCNIQIGGSDQWGNIIAGIDLINRVNAIGGTESTVEKGFGLVTPLLTTATGEKFGKSAGNAVSLDERVTNVFEFYQFFLRTLDADVSQYLKMFTLLPIPRIDEALEAHTRSPEKRIAQRLLAQEVTQLVHGKDGLRRAEIATRVLFDNDYTTLKADELVDSLRGLPLLHFFAESDMYGTPITKLAVRIELASSNSAARQLVAAKGLHVNNQLVTDAQQKLGSADLIDGRIAIIRAGKHKQAVVVLQ